jgi:hypothetical protein
MIFEKMFDVVKQKFATEDYKRKGSNPHANFEQSHPAVNKAEPSSFANPIEAGAKMFSEEQCGRAMPRTFDTQPGSDYDCPTDAHAWRGSNPHANFEQSRPAVNKEETVAFVNACESGAKKPSEAQVGKPMPETTRRCQLGDLRMPV